MPAMRPKKSTKTIAFVGECATDRNFCRRSVGRSARKKEGLLGSGPVRRTTAGGGARGSRPPSRPGGRDRPRSLTRSLAVVRRISTISRRGGGASAVRAGGGPGRREELTGVAWGTSDKTRRIIRPQDAMVAAGARVRRNDSVFVLVSK